MWYSTVISNSPDNTKEGLGLSSANGWVDVRDISEALVRALEKAEAGGERIIVSAGTSSLNPIDFGERLIHSTLGSYIWQEWIDVANKLLPSVAPETSYSLTKGYPELTASEVVYPIKLDTRKEEQILGVNFRSIEETTKDILVGAVQQGWV
jgi:nucleoside-diphosphate-sugar epimerase